MELRLEFKDLEAPLNSVIEQLARTPGLERIERHKLGEPEEDQKGASLFPGLDMKLAAGAAGAVFKALGAVLARLTATPTEVTIIRGKKSWKIKYDPRYEAGEDIAAMVNSLTKCEVDRGQRAV